MLLAINLVALNLLIANDEVALLNYFSNNYFMAWRLLCIAKPELVELVEICPDEIAYTLQNIPIQEKKRIQNLTEKEKKRFFKTACRFFISEISEQDLLVIDKRELLKRKEILQKNFINKA